MTSEKFLKPTDVGDVYGCNGGSYNYKISKSSWEKTAGLASGKTLEIANLHTDDNMLGLVVSTTKSDATNYSGTIAFGSNIELDRDDFFKQLTQITEAQSFISETIYFNNSRLIRTKRYPISVVSKYASSILTSNGSSYSGADKETGLDNLKITLKPLEDSIFESEPDNGFWQNFKRQMAVNLCALTAARRVLLGTMPVAETILFHDGTTYRKDAVTGIYVQGEATKDEIAQFAQADFQNYGGYSPELVKELTSGRETIAIKKTPESGEQATPAYIGPEDVKEKLDEAKKLYTNRRFFQQWDNTMPLVVLEGGKGVGKTTATYELAAQLGLELVDVAKTNYSDNEVGHKELLKSGIKTLDYYADTSVARMVYIEVPQQPSEKDYRELIEKSQDALSKNDDLMVVLNIHNTALPTCDDAEEVFTVAFPELTVDARKVVLQAAIQEIENGLKDHAETSDSRPFADDLNIDELAGASEGSTYSFYVRKLNQAVREAAFANAILGKESDLVDNQRLKALFVQKEATDEDAESTQAAKTSE